MGTLAIQFMRPPSEGIVNDSTFRGAQLIELDSADLRVTSKCGKKTHTFTSG
jgi:hypothetical protein